MCPLCWRNLWIQVRKAEDRSRKVGFGGQSEGAGPHPQPWELWQVQKEKLDQIPVKDLKQSGAAGSGHGPGWKKYFRSLGLAVGTEEGAGGRAVCFHPQRSVDSLGYLSYQAQEIRGSPSILGNFLI